MFLNMSLNWKLEMQIIKKYGEHYCAFFSQTVLIFVQFFSQTLLIFVLFFSQTVLIFVLFFSQTVLIFVLFFSQTVLIFVLLLLHICSFLVCQHVRRLTNRATSCNVLCIFTLCAINTDSKKNYEPKTKPT